MSRTSAAAAGTETWHPLAGSRMTGAEMIVQVLADEGVDVIFGYSGGAILPTYDAVFRYNEEHGEGGEEAMPLIVPTNEQGAGFMAAGYARTSGKVGVVMVTSGPGATNAVTPVRDCMADSVPIVVITGQVPTSAIGSDAFQEAPVSAIMGPDVAKHTFLVTDPTELEATVRTALEIARTGRPGPVVIDVPKDVQSWEGVFQGKGRLAIPGYRRRMRSVQESVLGEEACEEFFGILERSERPLIYAGGGVINAGAADAFREFYRTFRIPVVTTLMGIGSADTTEELSMGMLGMHGAAYANYAVSRCDFLVATGSRFDDRVAGVPEKFAPRAKKIAHFDVDPSEIDKVKPVDWQHVGVLSDALQRLTEYGRSIGFEGDFDEWLGETRQMKRAYRFEYEEWEGRIAPQHVIEAINELTGSEAVIATGVGQHQMWAAQYLDFASPRFWLTSGSMGTMGFGLPAAIGAQVARPDRLVIDIDGDGSIRMTIGELETATTYGLPVKVLVLNNHGDGMVRQWQRLFFKGRLAASDKSLQKKDFVKTAEADGFEWARRLDRKDEVEEVLREFIEYDGPAFLEVIVDPEAGVYPMVPPGWTYEEMITGEQITNPYDDTGDGSGVPASDAERDR